MVDKEMTDLSNMVGDALANLLMKIVMRAVSEMGTCTGELKAAPKKEKKPPKAEQKRVKEVEALVDKKQAEYKAREKESLSITLADMVQFVTEAAERTGDEERILNEVGRFSIPAGATLKKVAQQNYKALQDAINKIPDAKKEEGQVELTLGEMQNAARNVANKLGSPDKVIAMIAKFSTSAADGTLAAVPSTKYLALLEALDKLTEIPL